MNACRNCGSTAVKDLGFVGELAPFFLKRVLHLENGFSSSATSGKRFIQGMVAGPQKVLSRIRRSVVMTEMQGCANCSFVQTKHPFEDDSLGNLYRDYRSAEYNRERIHYEPTYKNIADQVGTSPEEMQARIEPLTAWLSTRIARNGRFSMLDYGGADGRFLPQFPGSKYVYEISDIKPAEGIISIKKESDLASYSYIQLAHILEHVPRPLEMVRRVAQWLAPGGYLYVEVPQDWTQENIDRLIAGSYRGSVPIHEHINLYTLDSATKLIQSAGLEFVDAESASVDYGWIKATVIRAIGKSKQ